MEHIVFQQNDFFFKQSDRWKVKHFTKTINRNMYSLPPFLFFVLAVTMAASQDFLWQVFCWLMLIAWCFAILSNKWYQNGDGGMTLPGIRVHDLVTWFMELAEPLHSTFLLKTWIKCNPIHLFWIFFTWKISRHIP